MLIWIFHHGLDFKYQVKSSSESMRSLHMIVGSDSDSGNELESQCSGSEVREPRNFVSLTSDMNKNFKHASLTRPATDVPEGAQEIEATEEGLDSAPPPPPILTVGPAPPFIDGVVTVDSFPIDAVELDMERVVDVGTGEPSSFSP